MSDVPTAPTSSATAALATDLPATVGEPSTSSTQAPPQPGPVSDALTVTLSDFAVVASVPAVAAGDVSMDIENVSAGYHNLLIIRTDLPPDGLPIDEDGAVDELADELEIVDEVSELPPGESDAIVTELAPGAYALVCKVVDEAGVHYQLGMRTALLVQ